MDSNFLEIVLDECGSVSADNEIFVYNPLQLCRNLITEGYSMDQLVHFFSEHVYKMLLDKKFLSQWCKDIGLQAPSDFCVFLLNDYGFKETVRAYNEIVSLRTDIENCKKEIAEGNPMDLDGSFFSWKDFCDCDGKRRYQTKEEWIKDVQQVINDDMLQISQEEGYLHDEWKRYTGTANADADELMSAELGQIVKWWQEFKRLITLEN